MNYKKKKNSKKVWLLFISNSFWAINCYLAFFYHEDTDNINKGAATYRSFMECPEQIAFIAQEDHQK